MWGSLHYEGAGREQVEGWPASRQVTTSSESKPIFLSLAWVISALWRKNSKALLGS